MKTPVRIALIVVGVILGVPVGASLGFFVVRLGGPLVFGPEFFTIGWLYLMFTVPSGAVFGAALGGVTIAFRPRLFALTILPLAVFFIGLQVTFRTLRGMDRPRTFVLDVVGTRNAKYVGIVSVDGEIHKLKGELPANHVFVGIRVELAFVLVHSNGEENIAVEVTVDERTLNTDSETQTGVYQHLRSFGYSETFGGTSRSWSRMTQEEVDNLIKKDRMPANTWAP